MMMALHHVTSTNYLHTSIHAMGAFHPTPQLSIIFEECVIHIIPRCTWSIITQR